MGIFKQITFLPVKAHKVDVKAESIPPDIPITKPSVFEFLNMVFSQLTICLMMSLCFIYKVNIKIKNPIRQLADGIFYNKF
jgi:hypothetical protein